MDLVGRFPPGPRSTPVAGLGFRLRRGLLADFRHTGGIRGIARFNRHRWQWIPTGLTEFERRSRLLRPLRVYALPSDLDSRVTVRPLHSRIAAELARDRSRSALEARYW